ncbi:MAG: type I-C CRISPR-associated protein Cas8c/Csd1 [Candidatus Sumerlaeia bacterium]|nr:type I-C CRISPR-associated protein Cas8c/Csd1 [Candidatus Sumerlaeia bacterium]
MILQALYQLAERERLVEDPDFEQKPVRFVVVVGKDGKFLQLLDTLYTPPAENEGKKAKKPKPIAKTLTVPRDSGFNMRKSNDYAGPLMDKREYLFGTPEENSRGLVSEERARRRRDLFRARAANVYLATKDEGVGAVLALLERIATGQVFELPADCGPGDLFAFSYYPDAGALVTERPAVREWWRRQRVRAITGNTQYQCLVSGVSFSDPGLFPTIKRAPGVAGDTSLVSYNTRTQTAFSSYGWRDNENGPIAREAAEAIATAMNRLLHPAFPVPDRDPPTLAPRSFRISADTAFCYWSGGDGGFEDAMPAIFGADPNDPSIVKHEVWRRLWSGKPPDRDNPADLAPFFGLVITGQTGRAILRDWFETTVREAQANVAKHFDDLRLVRNAPWKQGEEPPPAIALRTLLESVAAQGDQENIPSALASELVRAAMTGCLYPMGLLTRAVERARAEVGRSDWSDLQRRDARAALIKAVLNRRNRLTRSTDFKEVRESMDAGNNHPGYVLGALMAVLERLQQEALQDVNASVVDKHFSGASAAPRATFDRLLRNARHHAKKAGDGERAGFVFRLERLIDALLARINVNEREDRRAGRPIGFPLTLPIEEQGLFVIGYHHMRHWLWMNREDREAWEDANPDAPAAYLWNTAKNRNATADQAQS